MIDQKLNFLCSTNIFYGRGRFLEVPAYLAESGIKRILLVIDPYWWSQRSEVQDFLREISRREISYSVTFDIETDPSVACVERVRKSFHADGLEQPDAIVAIGGGSTIDVAKGLSALLRHGGSLDDLIAGIPSTLTPIPLIACPTTSGTGSELTPGAIFRQGTQGVKVGLMSNKLRPLAAFVDPSLTISCPRDLTLDSALDALTHAIESFLALSTDDYPRAEIASVYSGSNAVTKMFAKQAIALVFEHLPVVVKQPTDVSGRAGMSLASLFAAMSYSTAGLHGVHALGYALASATHRPHGQTLAVVLPGVLRELQTTCQGDLAELGRMLGSQSNGCEVTDANFFIDRLQAMFDELGVSTQLTPWGIKFDQVEQLVEDSVSIGRLSKAFPIQPPHKHYQRILTRALESI